MNISRSVCDVSLMALMLCLERLVVNIHIQVLIKNVYTHHTTFKNKEKIVFHCHKLYHRINCINQ